jgi:hypothetical protein
MSISKEDFINQTGGSRLGESDTERDLRFAEIRELEDRLRSGNYTEQDHRRLCELKDISFDAYDVEEHSGA